MLDLYPYNRTVYDVHCILYVVYCTVYSVRSVRSVLDVNVVVASRNRLKLSDLRRMPYVIETVISL